MKIEFGWYPDPLDRTIGDIAIATLPDLAESVAGVREGSSVDGDWVYAPPQRTHVMGHGEIERVYPSRVFGLPKTHVLVHENADGPEHLEFLVWALSFFVGMRLTTTEAGFLDATPLRSRKLIDFVLSPPELWRAMLLAEAFWQTNKAEAVRAKRWVAALHALYLAQYPLALQFEKFSQLYGALDTCFALAQEFHPLPKGGVRHQSRVRWMCDLFAIPMPSWADDAMGPSEVSQIRNPTIHESMFMDAPLGFAVHGTGTSRNLTLEMRAVVCRLLVALLGDSTSDYVRSPIDTRMMHGWSPP